jgi:hypothetical protein
VLTSLPRPRMMTILDAEALKIPLGLFLSRDEPVDVGERIVDLLRFKTFSSKCQVRTWGEMCISRSTCLTSVGDLLTLSSSVPGRTGLRARAVTSVASRWRPPTWSSTPPSPASSAAASAQTIPVYLSLRCLERDLRRSVRLRRTSDARDSQRASRSRASCRRSNSAGGDGSAVARQRRRTKTATPNDLQTTATNFDDVR